MHTRILKSGLILALSAAGTAQAHHSQAQFNLDPAVIETIAGTVTQYDFKNPHVYLYLQTRAADGSPAIWELEASSTPNLIRRGWSRDSVHVGDELTIDIHPAKVAGQRIARVNTIYFPNGETLAVRGEGGIPEIKDANAHATSLAGRWLGRYGLGQVQFDLAQWPLTPKGHAAQQAYDGTQNPQIDCIPVAAPSFMLYENIFEVTLASDRLVIDGEWLDVSRVIYLDGRAHPSAGERFLQGHSVGRWEGKTLVVETANFSDHGVGNAFEIPSGAQKRLVERLTLSDDGRSMNYEFVLEDPEYLSQPVPGSIVWDYRPDLQAQRIECDPEVARRFLERMTPKD